MRTRVSAKAKLLLAQGRTLRRLIVIMLVTALAAAPAALLAWAALARDPEDASAWAMAIPAAALVGVSMLFFATGDRQAIAKRNLSYGVSRRDGREAEVPSKRLRRGNNVRTDRDRPSLLAELRSRGFEPDRCVGDGWQPC
jgi:hypothetical protein